MLAFLIKRIGSAILVMLAVAFLAFLIFAVAGDPVEMLVNEQASQSDRDDLRERLGLDRPFLAQYVTFVINAAQGEFGISYQSQRDVMSLIASRLPATLELVFIASVLSLLVGIPLGVITAIYRGKWYSETLQFVSIFGVSLPSFVIAILLILVFSVWLGWAPGFGRGETVALGWWTTGFLTASGRSALVLPAIALALYEITLVMRIVRAEMLEVLRSDYVKFARARGVPRRIVHYRHALRNCLMPVATLTAMNFGTLIAFALVTETVFQWPGMGLLFIQAVLSLDFPIMSAYLVIISAIFVTLNTLVDIVYAVIDPRLRQEKT